MLVPNVVDLQEIFTRIPHRYPMLLVDRITHISPDGMRCVGLKNVTINEPYFQGHYPGLPIMPGVLIIEAMAQTGAIMATRIPKLVGLVPLIGAIDDAKFRRPVVPGDQLILEVELLWIKGPVGRMKTKATVEGEIAAEMMMTFKMRPPTLTPPPPEG